ncbi:hypothetical protein [Nonomuraea gerenzanensis]|uniref:hypothetical protein n=1 Tax=Nonomuraea gerenzanensis TaxID=93944 RepID=UPI001CD9CE72|nr:hypothetical protein [Nonomuraea gerenzanensis]UBU10866.1 hypothetical protein LCN96_42085 [Nonomuraea gerenzanensis]
MPDLVGAVLSASAVAAGVLAVSRGGARGWLAYRLPGRVGTPAALPLNTWRRRTRDPRRYRGSSAAATMAAAPAVPVVRRVGLGRVVYGGDSGPDGTIGTRAMPGEAIAVTGATVPIGRSPLRGPAPGHVCVLMAVLPATVLLAATALVRVAGASERQTGPRSRRAAQEGPAATRRRLLAEPRASLDQVRGAAGERPARLGEPPRVTHPL